MISAHFTCDLGGISQRGEDPEELQKAVEGFIYKMRIEAAVKCVVLSGTRADKKVRVISASCAYDLECRAELACAIRYLHCALATCHLPSCLLGSPRGNVHVARSCSRHVSSAHLSAGAGGWVKGVEAQRADGDAADRQPSLGHVRRAGGRDHIRNSPRSYEEFAEITYDWHVRIGSRSRGWRRAARRGQRPRPARGGAGPNPNPKPNHTCTYFAPTHFYTCSLTGSDPAHPSSFLLPSTPLTSSTHSRIGSRPSIIPTDSLVTAEERGKIESSRDTRKASTAPSQVMTVVGLRWDRGVIVA